MEDRAKSLETYTYGDYVSWPDEERWELIEGRAYSMSPAPNREHQRLSGALHNQIYNFLSNSECQVYAAPFDVRLPDAGEPDNDVHSVVQPDIAVICDLSRLDDKGCRGAPDWIIEILSPSTAAKDQREKLALYEKHGVQHYWLVHPTDRVVTVYSRSDDGSFGRPATHAMTGKLPSGQFEDLSIDWDVI